MATPQLKDDEDETEQTDTEEATDEEEAKEPEESEESEEEEEEVEVAEVERPDDDDDVTKGSIGAGTTFGISNKFLLLAGIGALLLVLYLKFIRDRTTRTYDSEEEIQEEVEESMDPDPNEEDGVNIDAPQADPLQGDEQAMGHIFEDQQ